MQWGTAVWHLVGLDWIGLDWIGLEGRRQMEILYINVDLEADDERDGFDGAFDVMLSTHLMLMLI